MQQQPKKVYMHVTRHGSEFKPRSGLLLRNYSRFLLGAIFIIRPSLDLSIGGSFQRCDRATHAYALTWNSHDIETFQSVIAITHTAYWIGSRANVIPSGDYGQHSVDVAGMLVPPTVFSHNYPVPGRRHKIAPNCLPCWTAILCSSIEQ